MGNKYEEGLVVKIGTNTLVRNGEFDAEYGVDVARQIADVREDGVGTVLVASGAMALGNHVLGANASRVEKARVGQGMLREGLEKSFANVGLESREVLITPGNVAAGELQVGQALQLGIVPYINGDDSSRLQNASSEVEDIGNNDVLGKILAIRFQAMYLNLTITDGVLDQHGVRIPEITHPDQVTVFDTKSQNGRGGMDTKLWSVYEVAQRGHRAEIADGRQKNVIQRFTKGIQVGTRIARQ